MPPTTFCCQLRYMINGDRFLDRHWTYVTHEAGAIWRHNKIQAGRTPGSSYFYSINSIAILYEDLSAAVRYDIIQHLSRYVIGKNFRFDLWRLMIFMTIRAAILPARRYASAGNSDRNVSVRLSVRPSVTRRYCVKTKKASGMISSPTGSPKTLVFWRQISSPNSKGFPRTGASNKGGVSKFSDFPASSVNISKTVADTAKVTISD